MTPMKAIRAKCLDCSCGSSNEVKLCPIPDCPLYAYRLGHNPKRAGLGPKGGNPAFLRKQTDSTSDFRAPAVPVDI